MYNNSFYVGYDNFSSTGHDILRTRILEKFKATKGFNYVKINELKFNSSGSEEARLEYLKQVGLDLKTNKDGDKI